MKKYFQSFIKIIKINIKTLLIFEFVYKLLISVILMPFAITSFNLIMRVRGYSYLTLDNIIAFFLNPITLILLLILGVFLTVITIFDIATLIIIFDASYQNKKISLLETIRISLKKCLKFIKIKNISCIFLVLFLIPFLNIGLESSVISSIKVPEFIMNYINNNQILLISYSLLYMALVCILLNWLYSFHFMIIEDKNFIESRRLSRQLIKKNRFQDVLKIFIAQGIVIIISIIFILLNVLILYLFTKITFVNKIVKSFMITLILLIIVLTFSISATVSNGISYATISALFYEHREKNYNKISHINFKKILKDTKQNPAIEKVCITIIAIITVVSTLGTFSIMTGKITLQQSKPKVEITAHRGSSSKYPENTIIAFKEAINESADWIELDVKMTKDNEIIVIHDSNLARTTGVNKSVNKLTYKEILKLDAGSFKGPQYKDERIPLLREVLELAKNSNIRLNIELKPTGKEKDFEASVIDLVKKYDFQNRCVIASQNYSVLKKVKELAPDFKTVYVMSVAIGNITELNYADDFSIEVSAITKTLVKQIHKEGHKIYAWTLNSSEKINQALDLDVDNIITDNVLLGIEIVNSHPNRNIINQLLEFFSIYAQ